MNHTYHFNGMDCRLIEFYGQFDWFGVFGQLCTCAILTLDTQRLLHILKCNILESMELGYLRIDLFNLMPEQHRRRLETVQLRH